ncbi:MAG: hypothetical protein JW940_16750 [Polyangiaceae bacterium]|nr:hypothetical protein [Polyangiaceae bacterium]
MKNDNALRMGVAAACLLGAAAMLPGCSKLDQTLGEGVARAGQGGEGAAGAASGLEDTPAGGGESPGVDRDLRGGAPGSSRESQPREAGDTGGLRGAPVTAGSSDEPETGGTGGSRSEPAEAGSSGEATKGSSDALASGGETSEGGSAETGGNIGLGGSTGSGGRTDAGGAPGSAGTTGSGGGPTTPPALPCDTYAAAETPCVAAYSMVRLLSSSYSGPLYQVRKGGSPTGEGGTTQDIPSKDGFGDADAQDAFCGTETCTVSKLYDQSGRANDLVVAKKGCYPGTSSEDDFESDATRRALTVSGHRVYALETQAHEGYRNNDGAGMSVGSEPQGIYAVANGKRFGSACCWDFGNGSKDNCYGPTGSTNALFFGTAFWGRGAGSGPWFMGDFDAGVWSGGDGTSSAANNENPSLAVEYAFGILKSRSDNYAIRVGNAQTGTLTTAYDGSAPAPWQMQGSIILGIASDNSNASWGTFFEGAITSGRPDDATDEAVLRNVQIARYGK